MRARGRPVTAGLAMWSIWSIGQCSVQWYSSPKAAITDGSYKLRPSNTTGVCSAALMCLDGLEVGRAESSPLGDGVSKRISSVARSSSALGWLLLRDGAVLLAEIRCRSGLRQPALRWPAG